MKYLLTVALMAAGVANNVLQAQIRLPQLVSDGMVLQRDKKINIWGWASPSERVAVRFNKKNYSAQANAQGNWQISLPAMKAGGPYEMQLDASNHLTLRNILIGDVWFFSGQSNMTTPMERVKEKYPEEIEGANYPQIRNFFVPTVSDVRKVYADLPPGKWQEATRENIMPFGAVAYFMAKQLHLKYHVPIGIINSSVGGTPIQAWISTEGYQSLPQYSARLAQFKDSTFLNRLNRPAMARPTAARPAPVTDKGLTGTIKWYDARYVPEGWHKFWLPGYWADQGVRNLNGIIWFRKEVDVPASMAGKPAKLFVGRIVDADETYVNGVKVGNITYQYPPRRYEVPSGLLKAGKNVIVVRVTNTSGKGGFVPDKRYELTDGSNTIDLRGDWLYQVGQVYRQARRSQGDVESGFAFSAQNEPTGLYNTMIAPATPYTIKGLVWYQGETNAGNAREYNQLMPALITDWRKKWKDDQLPFLYVQLPNYMEVQYSPSESQWAEMREAQLNALSVPRTAMVVGIDAGEWNDIHPLNKKDIGDRLALAAQNLAYGDAKVVGSGPILQSAKVDGKQIVLSFNCIGSGLMVKGGGNELKQFAIAGADKQFVWADARIEGNQVIVSSPDVTSPLYVRYAWADNPEGANLYNREGLPASPFRTDKP
jgi:sialate O-acetylesterase